MYAINGSDIVIRPSGEYGGDVGGQEARYDTVLQVRLYVRILKSTSLFDRRGCR